MDGEKKLNKEKIGTGSGSEAIRDKLQAKIGSLAKQTEIWELSWMLTSILNPT